MKNYSRPGNCSLKWRGVVLFEGLFSTRAIMNEAIKIISPRGRVSVRKCIRLQPFIIFWMIFSSIKTLNLAVNVLVSIVGIQVDEEVWRRLFTAIDRIFPFG